MHGTDRRTPTFDLGGRLGVHRLDVTPHEDRSSLEFVVHATLREVGEEEIAAVENSRLTMEQLIYSSTSIVPD